SCGAMALLLAAVASACTSGSAVGTTRPTTTAVASPSPTASVVGSASPTASVQPTHPKRPGPGKWMRIARMHRARAFHVAVRLLDGRVLVAGGYGCYGGCDLASVEIYDPRAKSWTLATPMLTPRAFFAAALLHGGRVLVAGGRGPKCY